MPKKQNTQLDLFENIKNAVWKEEKQQLGKLWERLYHFNMFVYNQKDENNNLKVVVKRDLYFDDEKDINKHYKVVITLRPQTIIDDNELKQSYLSKDESDIFDYILYRLSNGDYQTLNQKTCLVLSINEIRAKLKMDSKRIRKSLMLLNDYNIGIETRENNGIGTLPKQLFDGIYIGRKGRTKKDDEKTIMYISESLQSFVASSKNILINYDKMFGLSRIAKIFYKRLSFSNSLDKNSTAKQVIKMADKETLCSLLGKYGIDINERHKKARLFKEVERALEELKENNILSHYEYEDIRFKYKTITDFKIKFFITKEYSNKFSAYQILKPAFEKQVMMKDLERRRIENLKLK